MKKEEQSKAKKAKLEKLRADIEKNQTIIKSLETMLKTMEDKGISERLELNYLSTLNNLRNYPELQDHYRRRLRSTQCFDRERTASFRTPSQTSIKSFREYSVNADINNEP